MNTYPEKEKIAVVNRYLNGEKISQISQSTKISRTTIYLWIKERNNSFNKGKAPDFRYLHDLQEKCDRNKKLSKYCNTRHIHRTRRYQKDTK